MVQSPWKTVGGSLKTENRVTVWSSNPTAEHISGKDENSNSKDTYIQMFTEAFYLFYLFIFFLQRRLGLLGRAESIPIRGPENGLEENSWVSVGFLAVRDGLGEGLGAQPELQQDDCMACMQGSRAARRGWVCVPGELDEPQHQQPRKKGEALGLILSLDLQLFSSPLPLHGHGLGMRSFPPLSSPPGLSQPVPEQVSEPAGRHGPQEVGQCVEIPNVELVVKGAAEADANEVGGEEGRNNL